MGVAAEQQPGLTFGEGGDFLRGGEAGGSVDAVIGEAAEIGNHGPRSSAKGDEEGNGKAQAIDQTAQPGSLDADMIHEKSEADDEDGKDDKRQKENALEDAQRLEWAQDDMHERPKGIVSGGAQHGAKRAPS